MTSLSGASQSSVSDELRSNSFAPQVRDGGWRPVDGPPTGVDESSAVAALDEEEGPSTAAAWLAARPVEVGRTPAVVCIVARVVMKFVSISRDKETTADQSD